MGKRFKRCPHDSRLKAEKRIFPKLCSHKTDKRKKFHDEYESLSGHQVEHSFDGKLEVLRLLTSQ